MKNPVSDQLLLENIKAAFRNVRLGDGCGLHEARGYDDSLSEKEVRRLRQSDQTRNWSLIPSSDLNDYFSSLFFMDAKGIRFHLPAFMINEIVGNQTNGEILMLLTSVEDTHQRSKFAQLSPVQRGAIRDFLTYCQHSALGESYRSKIEIALNIFWKSSS